MKPTSIRRFDFLYLASIALSVVTYFLSYDPMVESMQARTAAAGVQLGGGTVIVVMVLSIGVSLLLWWLASQRRAVVAKWIIVLFFVLGLTGIPGLIAGGWTLLKTLSALNLLLEAAAVFYLFQPDAKAWFAERTVAAGPDQ
jgi:hypothetical protein